MEEREESLLKDVLKGEKELWLKRLGMSEASFAALVK